MPPRLMPEITEIRIDTDALAALEAMPAKGTAGSPYPWTPEKDEILLKYWRTRNHRDVCAVLKCSPNTAQDRYRKITADLPE